MSKLIFCPKCGNRYEEGDIFCQECGHKRPEEPKREPVTMPAYASDDMLGGQAVYEEFVSPATQMRMSQNDVMALVNRSVDMLRQGRKMEALEILENAREQAGWSPDFLCTLARMYRMNGNPDQALATYNECFRQNPNYPLAYANCAMVYCDMGRYKEAEKMCVTAITRFPKQRDREQQAQYAGAYANYAYAVGAQGRKEDAKRLLAEAERNGYPNGANLRKALGIK